MTNEYLDIKDLEDNFEWLKEGRKVTALYCGAKFRGEVVDVRANLYGSTNVQYEVLVHEDFTYIETEVKESGQTVYIYTDIYGYQVEG